MYIVLWVAVLCSLLVQGFANKQRCFECKEVNSPLDCTQVTLCTTGQQCYTREYITETGHIKYDLGCASSAQCTASSGGRRRGDGITACSECCAGEFCNIEGCGRIWPAIRGPMCFNCQTIDDPSLCSTVTRCTRGEGCSIHSTIDGISSVVYTSGCIGLACSTLNNATSALHKQCPLCCTDDYCNDHCRTT